MIIKPGLRCEIVCDEYDLPTEYGFRIFVRHEGEHPEPRWKSQLEGHPGLWACGKSYETALSVLLVTLNSFGYPPELEKYEVRVQG